MMSTPALQRLLPLALALFLAVVSSPVLAQCVSLATPGVAYSQGFDSLASSGTDHALAIPGWAMLEGGANADGLYVAGDGSGNAGNTYSFGANGSSDRALGGLLSGNLAPGFGACFSNDTGASLTALDISYTGEQWRLGTAGRADHLDFQVSFDATSLSTGSWTDVNELDFSTPSTAGTGAKDGNAAGNRTSLVGSIPGSIANGSTVWIRWTDFNASGADDGLAVDDFSLTPVAGASLPTLTINDVSRPEGNAGTTSFLFTVSLTAPAGPGGVTFDIATANNTAVAPGDYTSRSLTGQTIPAGSSTYAFNVLANGDTSAEANETFFVNVTSITGASAGDTQGTGTIINDDVALTPIHDIQGPGASSPIVGASVTTRGIVTALRSNGFFLQEPDASVDADPATSEGIFVFTSSEPPAAAALGALVQVSATVAEFVPAQDPLQPPLTELVSPTVVQLANGNPLPAPVPLTSSFPDPAGPHDQLERLEGMRVSIASLTVVAPTGGTINETSATATSNGVFHGVVTGLQRPFREPGIQAPDPAPAGGSIPPIPRFDANPELIRVDSDALGGAVLDLATGAVVTGLVGPLDYAFRRYTLLPEPASPPAGVGGATPVPASAPGADEVTIASYNLQRLFDTVDDPTIGEPVLTPAAYDGRLGRASLQIRTALHAPDVLGLTEVENLAVLQDLAARIDSDALANAEPVPQYQAYLVEGNDVGGIDVGFLVKTAEVAPGTPRVGVAAVAQELAGTLLVNPDSSTSLLNDRPPLVLDAVVNKANRGGWPVTVILNHLRSLDGSNDASAGSAGWPTVGARVRAKRQQQAEDLATLVQGMQAADPARNIVLVGDFNAFEFNDGLADVLGTIAGNPSPDNETAVPGDGADLVAPDLVNLIDGLAPTERYSYVFDGNAQAIDHVLANAATLAGTLSQRIAFARINADFPEVSRNSGAMLRMSDHDPLLVYLTPAGFPGTDLAVGISDAPDPVVAGTTLGYAVQVENLGSIDAADAALHVDLPAASGFASLSAPAGWSCTTPSVGAAGTVDCSHPAFAAGSAAFTITVTVAADVAAGTVLEATATVATLTPDDNAGNDSATAATIVSAAPVDLSVLLSASPDPVVAGTTLSWIATVANDGPVATTGVVLSLPLPAGVAFASGTVEGGGSCSVLAGTVSCALAGPLDTGAANTRAATIVGTVTAAAAEGSSIAATVTVASDATEANPADNSASTTTAVSTSADLATSLASDALDAAVGDTITLTATALNNGPSDAQDLQLLVTLPSGLAYLSVAAAGGSCAFAAGQASCSWPGPTAPGTSRSLELAVRIAGSTAVTVTAHASSPTADPDAADNAVALVVGGGSIPANPGAVLIPAGDLHSLALLAGLMLLLGGMGLRRRG